MRRIVKVLRSSHFDELMAKLWRLEQENERLKETLEVKNALLRSYMRSYTNNEEGRRQSGK